MGRQSIDADSLCFELVRGVPDPLPPVSDRHHRVAAAMFGVLQGHARAKGGRARFFGVRLALAGGSIIRMPDAVFVANAHDARRRDDHWIGADLVVEVMGGGPKDRMRDLVTKRDEYAAAAIGEYWMVDPENEFITVLRLTGATYLEAGLYERGHVLRSPTLAGLELDVRTLLEGQ
jgi:Uma2 family endonuclease